jgi:hypothetical protein
MLVGYNVVSGTDASRHHSTTTRHGFQRDQAETLPTLRRDNDANASKPYGNLSRRPFPEKTDSVCKTGGRNDAFESPGEPTLVRCYGANNYGRKLGKLWQ